MKTNTPKENFIEIPFGARDSETLGWEYTIPDDMEARIEDGKIIVRKKESEDEKIKKVLINHLKKEGIDWTCNGISKEKCLAWLEKQKPVEPTNVIFTFNDVLALQCCMETLPSSLIVSDYRRHH